MTSITMLCIELALVLAVGLTEYEDSQLSPPCIIAESAPIYMADAFADYYVPDHDGFNDSETVWCEEGTPAPKIGDIITL